MNWTKKEFTCALTEIEWIRYRYRHDKDISEMCDIIYKRIAKDRKDSVMIVEDIDIKNNKINQH